MEEVNYLRIFLSFAFILGLIGLMGWAVRRFDLGKLQGKLQAGKRLQVLEQLYLDPKRKIIILRCDNQEFLMVASATSEQLIPLPTSDPTSERGAHEPENA